MTVRFRQYQAFHAVVEKGTVTGAAEYLGVSQPAVSNLLAQLERSTKLPLFDRRRGRLVPTPEAIVLFAEVDTIVRGLDQVNQAVADLQNQKAGQLQIASTHALAFGFLPEKIAQFMQGRPNLTIAFTSQYSAKIQEWVTSGLFEIGICERPIRHDRLTRTEMSFETKLALPESSPLAKHELLTPQLMKDTPFIILGADHMVSRRSHEAFLSCGLGLRVRCHTDLFRNALSLVKQGLGAAFIDPFTLSADDGKGYVLRRFAPRITIDMVVITAKDRPLSSIGRQFLEGMLPPMRDLSIPPEGA